MEVVAVPTKLEDNFVLQNGDKGTSIQEAFKFNIDKVDNVYTWDNATKNFKFSFNERGTAYGETTVSQCLVVSSFTCSNQLVISLQYNPVQVIQWGLNFVGTVTVTHGNGNKYKIYIPGTRSYDPAGKTGDPHASERIGPSCSRTQAAITLGQLVAVLRGGDQSHLDELQEKLRPLINRYHGRETLFDWMFLQVKEATYLQKDVTPYPEFIKQRIMSERILLDNTREHTSDYLRSYNAGNPCLPELYYKKVEQKDPVSDIFDKDDLVKFKKLANINN